MDAFWQVILSNSIVACVLAAAAAVAARLRVNPAVVHVLLLLALVKLFTPPIVPVSVPVPTAVAVWQSPGSHSGPVVAFEGDSAAAGAAPIQNTELTAPLAVASWQRIFMAVWIVGAIVVATWYIARIIVMCRLLRHALPAPAILNELVEKHSRRLGLSRVPRVITLPVRITPAVWSLGTVPKIVFPAELTNVMDSTRLETLLVHELAHVKRRDHLIRLLEIVATTAFWWHPVVWWIRTQLREMEERVCDALVMNAIPRSARTYATALVETLEFLNALPRPLPIVATAVSPTVSLHRRIAMLKTGYHRTATCCAVLFAAAVGLPAMMMFAVAAAPAHSDDASVKSPPTEKRLFVSENAGEGNVAFRAVRGVHQHIAEVLGLDLTNSDHRAMIDMLVDFGVNLGAPHAAADGTQRRVIIRNTENADGELRILHLGDGDETDGKRRVIIRNPENADGDGEPLMLRLGEGENADGKRRIIIRNPENADGEPRMLRLRNPENHEGKVLRRGADGNGERMLIAPGDAAKNGDNQKVRIRKDASQE